MHELNPQKNRVTIREFKPEDLQVILALTVETQQEHHFAYPAIMKPADESALEQVIRKRLEDTDVTFLVAEKNQECCGFALLQLSHLPENPFAFERGVLQIDQLGVVKEMRGAGIGT